ncbi:hypothetical protein M011DRAFT_336037 [Sporormia fimetaria CBS 119925]|uniref:Uncharacterized protein n=1 Tax=Sporormia fimetaria CBS 119925 TaxID=1340428 RepID=A0A6A6VHZ0_9PLEO|nr:hypothetical protein M011DRAFT_336037 [Sporormia fimetaria CBS 119925]
MLHHRIGPQLAQPSVVRAGPYCTCRLTAVSPLCQRHRLCDDDCRSREAGYHIRTSTRKRCTCWMTGACIVSCPSPIGCVLLAVASCRPDYSFW